MKLYPICADGLLFLLRMRGCSGLSFYGDPKLYPCTCAIYLPDMINRFLDILLFLLEKLRSTMLIWSPLQSHIINCDLKCCYGLSFYGDPNLYPCTRVQYIRLI